jgi:hypothetical protein
MFLKAKSFRGILAAAVQCGDCLEQEVRIEEVRVIHVWPLSMLALKIWG